MKKVLFDGDSVRPYMSTRMPQFGEPNLRHLPDLFARLDTVENGRVFRCPDVEGANAKGARPRAGDAGRRATTYSAIKACTASPATASTGKRRTSKAST